MKEIIKKILESNDRFFIKKKLSKYDYLYISDDIVEELILDIEENQHEQCPFYSKYEEENTNYREWNCKLEPFDYRDCTFIDKFMENEIEPYWYENKVQPVIDFLWDMIQFAKKKIKKLSKKDIEVLEFAIRNDDYRIYELMNLLEDKMNGMSLKYANDMITELAHAKQGSLGVAGSGKGIILKVKIDLKKMDFKFKEVK